MPSKLSVQWFSKHSRAEGRRAPEAQAKPNNSKVSTLLDAVEAELHSQFADGIDPSLLAALRHLKLQSAQSTQRQQVTSALQVPVRAVFGERSVPAPIAKQVAELESSLRAHVAATLTDLPTELLKVIMRQSQNIKSLSAVNREFRRLAREDAPSLNQLPRRTREQLALLPAHIPGVAAAQRRTRAEAQLNDLARIDLGDLFHSKYSDTDDKVWFEDHYPLVKRVLTSAPVDAPLAKRAAELFPRAAFFSHYWGRGAFYPKLHPGLRKAIYAEAIQASSLNYAPRWMPVEANWGSWLPKWLQAVGQGQSYAHYIEEHDNRIALVPYDAACVPALTQALTQGHDPQARRFRITVVLQPHTFTPKEVKHHRERLLQAGLNVST